MMPTTFNFFDLNDFVSQRPELSKRKFVSTAVENTIKKVKKSIADEELAWIFENCFPNTLDTTVNYYLKMENLTLTLLQVILMQCGSEILRHRFFLI